MVRGEFAVGTPVGTVFCGLCITSGVVSPGCVEFKFSVLNMVLTGHDCA